VVAAGRGRPPTTRSATTSKRSNHRGLDVAKNYGDLGLVKSYPLT